MKLFSKRNTSAILNILGMTIAFTAFYVITSQVMFDFRYNSCINDAKNKYIVAVSWGDGEWVESVPASLTARAIDGVPGAKVGFVNFNPYSTYAFYTIDDDSQKVKLRSHEFSQSGAELMGVKITSGTFPKSWEGALISEKGAATMGMSIGDVFYLPNNQIGKKEPFTITGIFKNYPKNCDLSDCDIILNGEKRINALGDNSFNYSAIAQFAHYEDQQKFNDLFVTYYRDLVEELVAQYNKSHEDQLDESFVEKNMKKAKLVPLTKIHFTPTKYSTNDKSTYSQLFTLAGIAALIIAIAFINFINFFVALIPEKMRSANIRKVFGASRGALVWQFILVGLKYVGIAVALSVVVLLLLQQTAINTLVEGGVGLAENLMALLSLVGVSVILAVLTAFFPALKVTNVNAAIGVKKGYSHSVAGRLLRKTLITVQLCAATALMIISGVCYMQYRHMIQMELGINKENLYAAEIPFWSPEVKSAVEGIGGVKGVTASASLITGSANSRHGISSMNYSMVLQLRYVLPNFLRVMEIPMIYGMDFGEEPHTDEDKVILDGSVTSHISIEDLQEFLETYSDFTLSGLCQQTNLKSIDDISNTDIFAYRNMGYDYDALTTLIFRTEEGVEPSNVISQVTEVLKEYYQMQSAPETWTVDAELAHQYKKYKRGSFIVGLFSLIAILIALIGIFGIILFETEHRRHETAVRKVLGADVRDIIDLFCKEYLKVVLVAFAVATPASIIICRRYLEQFSSKIELSWWIFVVAFGIILILTMGIVALRTYIASRENPVKNLKSE